MSLSAGDKSHETSIEKPISDKLNKVEKIASKGCDEEHSRKSTRKRKAITKLAELLQKTKKKGQKLRGFKSQRHANSPEKIKKPL
ncbi:hypothetical protein GOP47_0022930 [Adiantum capillus-veneris]|uniref:Uncharacterized protein n=1 Tax=Adiantum capillus-veneris TaxID=13818 RepID=A0A9D4U6D1_ADICA|nr:hypothetical protein GOP47_0022930 [Adiantum capillus-veneris]